MEDRMEQAGAESGRAARYRDTAKMLWEREPLRIEVQHAGPWSAATVAGLKKLRSPAASRGGAPQRCACMRLALVVVSQKNKRDPRAPKECGNIMSVDRINLLYSTEYILDSSWWFWIMAFLEGSLRAAIVLMLDG